MATFRIPGPLRSLSGGDATVEVEATDVRSAIDALDAAHPGFKGRLLDENGDPRQFVNLFLNDEDVRLGDGLDAKVSQQDEIAIVPAVAGGR
ncbi:MAG: MoaD/ThiS family protein [Candidatus Dormibacteraeota bacterium]|nr:MoaD/ThiS family protein [Candidatus Dormibacteraeota bacterium]